MESRDGESTARERTKRAGTSKRDTRAKRIAHAPFTAFIVLNRVLFPPHISRADVKGAHLIDAATFPRATAAAANADSSSTAAAATAAPPPLSGDDLDDAMEAVYYFTHSLPLLRARWSSLHASDPVVASAAPYGMVEFLQYPGETVFVPHGWLHAVINLTPTVAVTQNYVSRANFAAAWKDAKTQRPHMARRWREQIQRHEPELMDIIRAQDAEEEVATATATDAATSASAASIPGSVPASAASAAASSSSRRADVSYEDAALDPDSWYWNPSSSESDDEEEEGAGDASYR